MFDTIGRVHALISERGISMQELIRRSGINPSTLRAAAARGSQLSVSTIERICAALEMPLWEFFDPDGSEKSGHDDR